MKSLSPFALASLVMTLLSSGAGAVGDGRLFVSPQGSDGNSGDPARPLRSIRVAAARARAGDLVVVAPGTYRESVVLSRSGKPGLPIVFRGLPGAVMLSPDPTASRSAFDVPSNVAYVTVQGFEIAGGYGETVFVRSGAHDIELAGLYIHDNRAGIWIGGASRVVLRDMLIQRHRASGVRIFAGASGVEVRGTRVELSDDGQGCDGDADGFTADESTADLRFEEVESVGNSEDGFDLQGRTMTVMRAVARDNGCTGVKLAGGGYVENLLVERSRVGFSAGADAFLQHGTLLDNDLGVRLLDSGQMVAIRNSIISGPGKAISYAAGVRLVEHHNLLHRPQLKDRLIVRIDGGGRETRFSGDDINRGVWRGASGQGEATIAADPSLESDTRRPSASSAAVDSGDALGSPPVDLDGQPRPAGRGVDRGAFERRNTGAALRLHRMLTHAGIDGSGQVRLRASVRLPSVGFDFHKDVLTLVLRGRRGEVLAATVTPGDWQVLDGREEWLRARVRDAGRQVQFSVHTASDRLDLWLRGSGADLWVLDGEALTAAAQIGRLRARATVPLVVRGRVARAGEGTFRVP